jgi:hypothetical protein
MKSFNARAAWLPFFVLGTSACGANVTPSADDHFELTTLADFEETMGLSPNPLWQGTFSNDKDHSMVPMGYAMTFEQASLSPERTNPDGTVSTKALHAADEGLFMLWGTAVYADLKNHKAVDLSAFTGFSIWARSVGPPGLTVKVGFADWLSFDQVADAPQMCDLIDRGDGQSCYDDYSAKIYPDGVWRRYDIAFSSLANGGWGYAHAFDQTKVYRIKFSLPPSTRYDLWLDDAAFFTKVFD